MTDRMEADAVARIALDVVPRDGHGLISTACFLLGLHRAYQAGQHDAVAIMAIAEGMGEELENELS